MNIFSFCVGNKLTASDCLALDRPENGYLHKREFRTPWYCNGMAIATDGRAICARRFKTIEDAQETLIVDDSETIGRGDQSNTGAVKLIESIMDIPDSSFTSDFIAEAGFAKSGQVLVLLGGRMLINPVYFEMAFNHQPVKVFIDEPKQRVIVCDGNFRAAIMKVHSENVLLTNKWMAKS